MHPPRRVARPSALPALNLLAGRARQRIIWALAHHRHRHPYPTNPDI
jgi:hypothetical protein